MTELEKYELVNSAESTEELLQAVQNIYIETDRVGRTGNLDKERMLIHILEFIIGMNIPANSITRQYGIRQQAMYLKYYKA